MDKKLKHLEFIQGVINRLSTNSFLLKGWSVLLVSALIGFSVEKSKPIFAVLALLPSFVFWGLDGYFLCLEKAYRRLYDSVRSQNPEDIDFSMNIEDVADKDGIGFNAWVSATMSKTLIPFHSVLLAAIIIVFSCL